MSQNHSTFDEMIKSDIFDHDLDEKISKYIECNRSKIIEKYSKEIFDYVVNKKNVDKDLYDDLVRDGYDSSFIVTCNDKPSGIHSQPLCRKEYVIRSIYDFYVGGDDDSIRNDICQYLYDSGYIDQQIQCITDYYKKKFHHRISFSFYATVEPNHEAKCIEVAFYLLDFYDPLVFDEIKKWLSVENISECKLIHIDVDMHDKDEDVRKFFIFSFYKQEISVNHINYPYFYFNIASVHKFIKEWNNRNSSIKLRFLSTSEDENRVIKYGDKDIAFEMFYEN